MFLHRLTPNALTRRETQMSALNTNIDSTGRSAGEMPYAALPLGGIGTGNLAIGADGWLKQWQLHNIGNHLGELPGSFFAARISQWEPPFDAVRILAAPPTEHSKTPLVNDDHVARWQQELAETVPTVTDTRFSGAYPMARIDYLDETLPVSIRLEAFTPIVPLNAEDSALPVACFKFTVKNHDSIPVHGWIGAGLQNAVGHDGIVNPDGVRASGYGGNTNRVVRGPNRTSILMENRTLDESAAGYGTMALTAEGDLVSALTEWTDPEQLVQFLSSRQNFGAGEWSDVPKDLADPQPNGVRASGRPSAPGSTWNGGLAVQFAVEPGAQVEVRFLVSWHFPNRYVNFTQFGGKQPAWGQNHHLIGNEYTNRFANALAVAEETMIRWDELEAATKRWISLFTESDLDPELARRLLTQAAIVRSPSYFRTADGRTWGFEGVLGASTPMWAGQVGGSCPLNCTHVHAYSQGLARLFPALERNMRETEFEVMQAPEGFIPHRVLLPLETPQIWDRPIGGPEDPALDGMLSIVLRTYREVKNGAGLEWLGRYWPNLRQLMDHICQKWDPNQTGMLHGIQPSTHDIDLCGLNTFMGTYWLAALRSMEEMAHLLDEEADADDMRRRFETGSVAYDRALFNGEYYRQVLEPGDRPEFQWLDGCLSDQVIGQWWAHELDLGYLLPEEHVRSALEAVVRHNLRASFVDFVNPYRVYADGDDSGLLMCSWPTGGRPSIPTRYCDEVWSGIEYQVAAHCFYEGLEEQAWSILRGLWARHDGKKRNPYNEIECGDHYVRALSGWSLLHAWSGFKWDSVSRHLQLSRTPERSIPILLDQGWGALARNGDQLSLECRFGQLELDQITVGETTFQAAPIRLQAGETLQLS